jgi:hypothetical protein
MKLVHFYHVYADGDWLKPATEHIEELAMSGLLDNLDDMFLGIVGSPENREKVKRELPGVTVTEADSGWEQITLRKVHDFAQVEDAAVFYAHTKGAWSKSDLAEQWRVSMTHDTVTRWIECVKGLSDVDVVGAHWLRSGEPEHAHHDYFFAGNFWWANTYYVRKLDQVDDQTRFQAEGWIGLRQPRVKDMRPGLATWGNFWQP